MKYVVTGNGGTGMPGIKHGYNIGEIVELDKRYSSLNGRPDINTCCINKGRIGQIVSNFHLRRLCVLSPNIKIL